MNCKLIVKNEALKDFLGKAEFDSFDDYLSEAMLQSSIKNMVPFFSPKGYEFVRTEQREEGLTVFTNDLEGNPIQIDGLENFSAEAFTGLIPSLNGPYDFKQILMLDLPLELLKTFHSLYSPFTDVTKFKNEILKHDETFGSQPPPPEPPDNDGPEEDSPLEDNLPNDMPVYQYTNTMVYDSISKDDTLPNVLELSDEPVNLVRNRLLIAIQAAQTAGQKFFVRIEKDTLDNVQTDELTEDKMGVVAVLYDENMARIYVKKKDNWNDKRYANSPIEFTTDISEAQPMGVNNSVNLTFVVPILSNNYETLTKDPIREQAILYNSFMRTDVMNGETYTFDFHIQEDPLSLPKDHRAAWPQRISVSLGKRSKRSVSVQLQPDGFVRLNIDGKSLPIYPAPILQDEKHPYRDKILSLVNQPMSMEDATEVRDFLKKLFRKDFKFNIVQTPNGYSVTVSSHLSIGNKLESGSEKDLTTGEFEALLKHPSIRINIHKKWIDSSTASFDFLSYNGTLVRTKTNPQEFFLQHTFNYTRLINLPNENGKKIPTYVPNHSIYFTEDSRVQELLVSATTLTESFDINGNSYDLDQDFDLVSFLDDNFKHIMDNSDVTEAMSALYELITQGQVNLSGKITFTPDITDGGGKYGSTIFLASNLQNNPKKLGEILTHELIHLLTSDWIDQNPNHDIVRRLNEIAKNPKYKDFISEYRKDPKELIAALTSREFRDKAITKESKSLLSQVADILRDILNAIFGTYEGEAGNINTELVDKLVQIMTMQNKASLKVGGRTITFNEDLSDGTDWFDSSNDVLGSDEKSRKEAEEYLASKAYKTKTLVHNLDADIGRLILLHGKIFELSRGELNEGAVYQKLRQSYFTQIKKHNAGEIVIPQNKLDIMLDVCDDKSAKQIFNAWRGNTLIFKTKRADNIKINELDGEEQENLLEIIDTEDYVDDTQEKREAVDGDDETNNLTFDRSGFEKSVIQGADKAVRSLIKLLPKIEKRGRETIIYTEEEAKALVRQGMASSYFINVPETNTYVKIATNENGLPILNNYTETFNRLAQLWVGTAPLSEKMKLLNKDIVDTLPEAYFLRSVLSDGVKNDSDAYLKLAVERTFQRFYVPVKVVLINPKTGVANVINESKDVKRLAIESINTNFLESLSKEPLRQYYNIEKGTFNAKQFLIDNEINTDEDKEAWMPFFGFDLHPDVKAFGRYKDLRNGFFKILENAKKGELSINLGNVITDDYLAGKDEFGNELGLSQTTKDVYKFEDKLRPFSTKMVVQNAEGETQSTYSLASAILQDIEIYNDPSLTEETLNEKIGRTKNPLFKYSISRGLMFGTGTRKINPIQINNWSGLKVTGEGVSSKGKLSGDLTEVEKVTMDIVGLLNSGLVENTRAETASTSFAYRFTSWHDSNINATPLTWQDFQLEGYGTEAVIGKESGAMEIYKNYFRGELERKLAGEDFVLFEGYEAGEINDVETYMEENDDTITSFIQQMLLKEVLEYRQVLRDTVGHYDNLPKEFYNKYIKNNGPLATDYFVAINALTLHIEEAILFHGDLSVVKNHFKRAKSIQSTGIVSTKDPSLIEWINQGTNESSFGALIGKPLVYGDTYKTSVIKDDLKKSIYAEQLGKGFLESKLAYDRAVGIEHTLEQLKTIQDKADALVKAYTEAKGEPAVNIGDGAAIMNPDFGRAFAKSVNSWTPDHEAVYRYMVAEQSGKPLTEEEKRGQKLKMSGKVIFPIFKLTQRGNIVLSDSNFQEEIMDKFALVWAFPEVMRDKPLGSAMLDHMLQTGQAYIKMESGSKLSKPGITSYVQAFEEGKPIATIPYEVHQRNLREQLVPPPKAKDKTILGSQFRELLISGIFGKDGLPIKLENEEFAGQLRDKWINSIQSYTSETIRELLNKVGVVVPDGNIDGDTIDFTTFDTKKLLNLILEKMDKDEVSENMKQYYEKLSLDENDYKYFEASFSSGQVENMFASILNKVVTQKIGGSQLIQTPSTFFDTYSKTGTRDLKYYREENGKWQPAECKISLMGEFMNLLNLPEVQGETSEEKLSSLNKLLKDKAFRDKHRSKLTFAAYRIPTQGYNSMEILEIAEFLPPYMAPAIVPPPEIVIKSGTDYDYDKLTAVFPSIDKFGNLRDSNHQQVIEDQIITRGAELEAKRNLLESQYAVEGITDEEVDKITKELKHLDIEIENLPKTMRKQVKPKSETQTEMVQIAKDILLSKENIHRLIAPNSTDIVEGPLSELLKILYPNPSDYKAPTASMVYKYRTNFLKWKAVKLKNLLGIAAVNNRFFSIVQNHSFVFNETYNKQYGRGEKAIAAKRPVKGYFQDSNTSLKLYLPDGQDGVAKLDMINQMINVTVDAASDDRFGYLDIGLNDFDALFFMSIGFGVPLSDILFFLQTPELIAFRKVLKKNEAANPDSKTRALYLSIVDILNLDMSQFENKGFFSTSLFETKFLHEELGKIVKSNYSIDREEIKKSIIPMAEIDNTINPARHKYLNEAQKNNLIAYLAILEQSSNWTELKGSLNYDSAPDSFILKIFNRREKQANVRETGMFNQEAIDSVSESSIKSALRTDYILEQVVMRTYPTLYSPANLAMFDRYLKQLFTTVEKEKAYRMLSSDYMLAIIQTFDPVLANKLSEHVRGTGNSKLLIRAKEIQEELGKQGISLRLLDILQVNIGNNKTNIKVDLGYENSKDAKDAISDEWRYLLNQEKYKDFAETLAYVAMGQSGWAQSPLYFSDMIPEELAAKIITPAIDRHNSLDRYEKKKFRNEFIKVFQEQFKSTAAKKSFEDEMFEEIYSTKLSEVTYRWKPYNLDYSVSKEEIQKFEQAPEKTSDTVKVATQGKVVNGKNVVVPAGSNPNNRVVAEDENNIYLMNDGQQAAFDKITSFIKQQVDSSTSSLDDKVTFEDPLGKPYSSLIPKGMWDNMIGLVGVGGSGKSTTIKSIIEATGVNAVYLAPTHQAVTVLQDSLGVDSENAKSANAFGGVLAATTAAFVYRNQGKESEDALIQEGEQFEELFLLSTEKYKENIDKGFIVPISQKQVIIVDESSMIKDSFVKDILLRLEAEQESKNIKFPVFILLGDYRQLPPVDNAKDNTAVKEGVFSATVFNPEHGKLSELTQVMRTKDIELNKVFSSVGEEIKKQRQDVQSGEAVKPISLANYDEVTKQSTENLLVYNAKDTAKVIDLYTNTLASTNDPYKLFWVHYNNLQHAKTKELFKVIRETYFKKLGKEVKSENPQVGDFVQYSLAFPMQTNDVKLTDLQNAKRDEDSLIDYREAITKGNIKPTARFKLVDVTKSQMDLFTVIPELRGYVQNMLLDSKTYVLFNKQGKLRAVNSLEDVEVISSYDKQAKRMKIMLKTQNDSVSFELPYPVYLQIKNSLNLLKAGFNSMFKPSYIGSSHTVQGATLKGVIVGDYNIRSNSNIHPRDFSGSLYVALTRAAEKLIIIKPDSIKIENNQEVFKMETTPTQAPTQGRKTYEGLITNLADNQVFVFGSNPIGVNGNVTNNTGGAALVATKNNWVKQGEKMDNKLSESGKAWGLVTVSAPGKKRSKSSTEIEQGIQKLYNHALENPNTEFLVAYTGTGTNLNGYTNQELADMFSKFPIPDNIVFEKEFSTLLSSVQTPNQEQASTGISTFTNHSGGAVGSDTQWDLIGREFGMVNNKHYYYGTKTPNGNTEITQEQLEEGWQKVLQANKTLQRRPDQYKNLLSRNWMQVKNSDAIFAIGKFQVAQDKSKADNLTDPTKSVKSYKFLVDGGTGWAVQMAIDANKPVFFFDQVNKKWFKYTGNNVGWEQVSTPTLTPNFAGIGTREINEAGIQAIRDVYANTAGTTQEETDTKGTLLPIRVLDSIVYDAIGGNQPGSSKNTGPLINDLQRNPYNQNEIQITKVGDNFIYDEIVNSISMRIEYYADRISESQDPYSVNHKSWQQSHERYSRILFQLDSWNKAQDVFDTCISF